MDYVLNFGIHVSFARKFARSQSPKAQRSETPANLKG